MESLLQDLRVAARTLRLRPGFTIAAALTIALGIGATTSVFSVVYSIVLRPLPYRESERLVAIWPTDKQEPNRREAGVASAVNARDWKQDARSFEAMTTFVNANLTLQAGSEPQVMAGARVGTDFFRVFGVRLALGREFTAQETTFGGPQAAVLSHGLWQEQFGGRPNVIGQSIEISGVQRQIVGVAAAGFDFPNQARLWIDDENDDESCGRGCVNVGVLGRLRSGVTLDAAREELRLIADRMEQAFPAQLTGQTVVAATLQEIIVGDVRKPLFILFGAISMVLLIACANMANLLLVRGSARVSEMAVRATLGASRFRLIRQLLTESALLAIIGALAGVLLASWILEALKLLSPGNLPRLEEVTVGVPGWLFALALVGLT
ncbi:MAG TPA: ABC transporter permease, partial [Longimicrobiales bacterium]|nr:ABC transporter permease [Longimicrobiales bacterium]